MPFTWVDVSQTLRDSVQMIHLMGRVTCWVHQYGCHSAGTRWNGSTQLFPVCRKRLKGPFVLKFDF